MDLEPGDSIPHGDTDIPYTPSEGANDRDEAQAKAAKDLFCGHPPEVSEDLAVALSAAGCKLLYELDIAASGRNYSAHQLQNWLATIAFLESQGINIQILGVKGQPNRRQLWIGGNNLINAGKRFLDRLYDAIENPVAQFGEGAEAELRKQGFLRENTYLLHQEAGRRDFLETIGSLTAAGIEFRILGNGDMRFLYRKAEISPDIQQRVEGVLDQE